MKSLSIDWYNKAKLKKKLGMLSEEFISFQLAGAEGSGDILQEALG
jgi:hypothetical protein